MKPALPPLTLGQWALALGLVAVILVMGATPEPVFAWLTLFWQRGFEAVGLGRLLQHVQQGTSTDVTTRSLPAVATYAVLYLATCLLLLRVLLRSAALWRQALAGYAATVGLIAVLLLVGKLGGNSALFYKVARRLIDFIASPLPVVLLLALLLGPQRSRPAAP